MKTSKLIWATSITLAVIAMSVKAQAQTTDFGYSGFKCKSGNRAFLYSALGTIVPVAAGVAWWVLDAPEKKTRTYTDTGRPYYQWSNYGNYYYEYPDRTVPICLILSALTIGPSLGYFYGGCTLRGATGLMIRMGTGAAVGSVCWGIADHSAGSSLDAAIAGIAFGTAGALIFLSDVIYDIVKVKSNVEKNNARKSAKSAGNVTLFPAYFAESGAGGLKLNINF